MQMLVPKAMQMIHDSLKPLLNAGCRIERLKLVVCPSSKIAEYSSVKTLFGQLKIESNSFVPRGVSYLIEDPGRKGRGFAWVSRVDHDKG